MACRIGCVSYLNSRPLVWGLDHDPAISMRYDVPAKLLPLLLGNQCELALLPVIDYQQADDLVILPASCIGADGPVYTVRLFSRTPVDRIARLHVDVESRTSAALCRIVLKRRYGIEPQLTNNPADADARLLIGDKVVIASPSDHPYELDLAEAWHKWTGLPFVFAVWMMRKETRPGDVQQRLRDALKAGMANVQQIIDQEAVQRGWPAQVAREYLTRLLKFEIDLAPGSRQRQALELFYREALALGISPRCRAIEIAQ